ncbi:MAG: hypothetical protein JNK14_11955 [Chitinophagaceae bacterium]|nr:hypothetical protein [Chitinophagaceae bacterium]
MIRIVVFAGSLLLMSSCYLHKAGRTTEQLIFKDEFNDILDSKLWVAEVAPQPDSKVYIKDGQLFLDTKGGVTVWLNRELKGNIRIEYTRRVIVDSGINDRLSDLNTFWMATDPKRSNLFTRNGVLESYDSLQMYYVGMGGNTNRTTRFRKYEGNGERTLLKEYTDTAHLLQPNKAYKIVIEIKDAAVSYIVDGVKYFVYTDPAVLTRGYFGFRSTKSRQAIDHIRIWQLH